MSIQCRVLARAMRPDQRLNALLGAAKAAEKLGKMQEAAGYYRTLLKSCPEANSALGRLLDPARMFLNVARRR